MKTLLTLITAVALLATDHLQANYTQEDVYIVASTILGEARGEGSQGMLLVADVIHTRMESNKWPNTAAEVCTQKSQFDGSHYIVPDWGTFEAIWATTLAELLLLKKDPLPDRTYTHFWSGDCTPYWARHYPVYRYRNHNFIDTAGPKYHNHIVR